MMFYEIIETLVRDGAGAFGRSLLDGLAPELSAQLSDAWSGAPDWSAVQLLAMQTSLALCIVLVGLMMFIKIKKSTLSQAAPATAPTADMPQPAPSAGPLRDRWNGVLGHLDSPRENDWKVAVIEADKMIDDALTRAGFAGDTFGDRLMNIQPGTLISLDGIWWAHKVRNRLAHEPDYFLRYTEAKQAIGYFEAALTELELL